LGGTITHVLGARPNFVKAAPVIRALATLGYAQRVVHTGQHYDERMSEIFFVQLGLPRPDINLGVGSGTQARQTAEVMVGMELEFTEHDPALAHARADMAVDVLGSGSRAPRHREHPRGRFALGRVHADPAQPAGISHFNYLFLVLVRHIAHSIKS